METSEQTRKMVPVFVEKTDDQDIRDLLYVRGEDGVFTSLAQLKSLSGSEYSAEFFGELTTGIIEPSGAEGGMTIRSVSASASRLCCVRDGSGRLICYICP